MRISRRVERRRGIPMGSPCTKNGMSMRLKARITLETFDGSSALVETHRGDIKTKVTKIRLETTSRELCALVGQPEPDRHTASQEHRRVHHVMSGNIVTWTQFAKTRGRGAPADDYRSCGSSPGRPTRRETRSSMSATNTTPIHTQLNPPRTNMRSICPSLVRS